MEWTYDSSHFQIPVTSNCGKICADTVTTDSSGLLCVIPSNRLLFLSNVRCFSWTLSLVYTMVLFLFCKT